MEGHRHTWDSPAAPRQGSPLAGPAAGLRGALAASDMRGARRVIAEAVAAGRAADRLYVEIVRPAIDGLEPSAAGAPARLAAGIRAAILSDLVARLPRRPRDAGGRAAILSCRKSGIEAVDGGVAVDYLRAGGWSVERLAGEESRAPRAMPAHHGAFELAVVMTTGPEDAPRLAPVCTDLRRVADPPVILLCDFSGRCARGPVSSVLGVDAVAHDPEELMRCAIDSLPATGSRRWGVRLSRAEGGLTMTPTGRLDSVSVHRLADVALTRSGTFSRLVLDLRDLAEFDADGVRELAGWPTLVPSDGIDLLLVADVRARQELDRAGADLPWTIAERPLPPA